MMVLMEMVIIAQFLGELILKCFSNSGSVCHISIF
jgi:hypothetical protein